MLSYEFLSNKHCITHLGGEANTTPGSTIRQAAVSENVAVRSVVSAETQSTISMKNTQRMAALLSKLGTIN